MQSDCAFTTSPTPSPTHPLSVPYTSPTSPTNVPRFQTFHLMEMQWCRQGNHSIDKPASSTGAPPIPKASTTSCNTRHRPSLGQPSTSASIEGSVLPQGCPHIHGAYHGSASMLVPAAPGDRACETKPLARLLATYPGWSTRRRNPTRQTKSVVPLRSADTG